MTTVLMVRCKDHVLSDFESYMKTVQDFKVFSAQSCKEALDVISKTAIDLVIADENLEDMTGLEFVRKLININPMTNCAVVSSLSQENFHEASEGLGILMQLPVHPTEKHAQKLISHLSKIINISNTKGVFIQK